MTGISRSVPRDLLVVDYGGPVGMSRREGSFHRGTGKRRPRSRTCTQVGSEARPDPFDDQVIPLFIPITILLVHFQEFRTAGILLISSQEQNIQSILDWHHSNLRRGALNYCINSALGPVRSLPLNPQAAIEDEKILSASLSKLESVWLKGDAKFLLGNLRPSVADLSLACEIMQLEVVDEKDRERILGPHPKILEWIDNVKCATSPHFEEVHEHLQEVKGKNSIIEVSLKSNPKPLIR
ncbi:glutathione S-transferase T1-like [Musa acuminata AAA Group]|uniref:glutathione S-transferase T1-like n=1 Tax=Musa acuminata AAA Group TaxID=214697 RepID=UPI0031DCEF76